MEDNLHYFAYGSNMSSRRLAARVSGARALSSATLEGHELRFHKRGQDGSGKCDIHETDREDARVFGALFALPFAAKATLDRIEGLGAGYEEKVVSITDAAGGEIQALTYYATDIKDALQPFCWYRHHVLAGAQEFQLPENYIRAIVEVPYIGDRDDARRAREMSIYQAEAEVGSNLA